MDFGDVTQPFGCTGFSLEPPNGDCNHFHFGTDFAGKLGDAVISPTGGTVSSVGKDGPFGLSVHVLDDQGKTWIFGHLSNFIVKVGEAISPGFTLGAVGSTGNSSGPHLHVGVMDSLGTWVDPKPLIEGLLGQKPVQTGVIIDPTTGLVTDTTSSSVPVVGGIADAITGLGVRFDQTKKDIGDKFSLLGIQAWRAGLYAIAALLVVLGVVVYVFGPEAQSEVEAVAA